MKLEQDALEEQFEEHRETAKVKLVIFHCHLTTAGLLCQNYSTYDARQTLHQPHLQVHCCSWKRRKNMTQVTISELYVVYLYFSW